MNLSTHNAPTSLSCGLKSGLAQRDRACPLAALLTLAGLAAGLLAPTLPAAAVEEVQLTYGGIPLQALPLSDLVSFSETGRPSEAIALLLDSSGIEPAMAQAFLSTKIAVDSELFNQAADTFIGEAFFQLMGTAFTLPETDVEGWQSLRSALMASAADNQLSAVEVLQNVDHPAIVIDAQALMEVAEQMRQDIKDIEAFTDSFRSAP